MALLGWLRTWGLGLFRALRFRTYARPRSNLGIKKGTLSVFKGMIREPPKSPKKEIRAYSAT